MINNERKTLRKIDFGRFGIRMPKEKIFISGIKESKLILVHSDRINKLVLLNQYIRRNVPLKALFLLIHELRSFLN